MALRETGRLRFHSPEDVERYTREALEVAEACELSGEDRAVLLPTILATLAAHQVTMDQVEIGAGSGLLSLPQKH